MPTEKLYYSDCHLKSFTATVTGCEASEKGWLVTLSATAFYPEGGGQACDLGRIGGVSVLDVRERGEEIFHLCDGPLTLGDPVECAIDWDRRFDLMQQHTGEHILSGLIHQKFGWHNVGFHMGKDTIEIDFDGPIPQEALGELELAANEAIWANLPVKCWYPAENELPNVTYRSKKALPWPVRIVQVPGFDSCACCGVHVERTGEIGFIKILTCVKFHQGVRLEMVCGSRAYRWMANIFDQNRQVSQLLSAKMPETGEAVRRLQEAYGAEKFRAAALQKRIFAAIADSYVNQENVLHFEPGLECAQVRLLAEQISEKTTGYAAVFSGEGESYSYCVVTRDGDLRELGKAMTAALCGRGGGKPNFQQGSVKATKEQIEAFFGDK